MFDTGEEEWRYATHGGTAFVINRRGKYFAITCKHVLGDFEWKQLRITDAKFGGITAGIRAINYPSDPREEAIESEVLDIVIVEFSDDAGSTIFKDRSYIIDPGTVGRSARGDVLVVNGVLKDESNISPERIAPMFGLLELLDAGAYEHDAAVRKAKAILESDNIRSVTGMSGSPVFNVTKGILAGVVVRGGMTGREVNMYYVEILDVVNMLDSVATGTMQAHYKKIIPRLVR